MSSRLHQLSALGQSVWIDYPLARPDRVRRPRERRSTRTPSSASPRIRASSRRRSRTGDAYDEQIAASDEATPRASSCSLAMRDVATACDLLRPVWDADARPRRLRLDRGRPDPRRRHRGDDRAGDALPRGDRAAEPAGQDPGHRRRRSRDRGDDRSRLLDQRHSDLLAEPPPAGGRGLPARARAAVAAGGDPSRVHSVASFFVSRVDTETDRRLAETGRDDLKGRLGDRQRQARLPAIQGAVLRRALGGAGRARRDHAALPLGVDFDQGPKPARHALRRGADRPGDDLDDARGDDPRLSGPRPRRARGSRPSWRGAQHLFDELYAAGVDYDDVVATLEREGIEKFVASFDELLQRVADKRRHVTASA